MSILCFYKVTALQIYIYYFAQRFLQIEAETLERLGLFPLGLLTISRVLFLLMQNNIYFGQFDSHVLFLILIALYTKNLSRKFIEDLDYFLFLARKLQSTLLTKRHLHQFLICFF